MNAGTLFQTSSAAPPGPADVAFAEVDEGDVRLLAQAGFMASGAGDAARAQRIFGALQPLRPDRAWPHIGAATALLNAGKPADAVRLLVSAAGAAPDEAAMLQAFLGLALQLDGRSGESQRMLRAVVAETAVAHSDGARLARRLLGQDAESAPPESL